MKIDEILKNWSGDLACVRYDHGTEAFFAVAIDSRAKGPAAGGTRAMVYPSWADAIADATRLASAMTLKMAMANLPMGGGKSVIALPRSRHELSPAQWADILAAHADTLSALGGNYWTGPDVGTASVDMDELHRLSGYAFGRSESAGGPGSSAPETAHGVFVAIRAALREAGTSDFQGSRVAVQGLGAVGMDVARRVATAGAHVVAADTDEERCRQAAAEFGAEIVDVSAILGIKSDVFAPCATGGVIDDDVAARIDTRVVAGAANNVLAVESAADRLSERRIVLAPDFVANGGGAIHLIGREVLGWSAQQVADKVEEIDVTLRAVFKLASSENLSAESAARRIATERLKTSA